MTITVTLDDFVFQDFEVPERINFGGAQMLKLHRQLGGKRVIDVMGPDDDPLEWSGRFRGIDAISRARTLDAKRKAGKAIPLSWGEFSLTVVIAHFKAEQEFGLEVPYTIRLEVVEEQPLAQEPGLDEMAVGDQASADDLVGQVGDPLLSSDMGSLDAVMGKVGSFADATLDTLSGVIGSVAMVRSRVTSMIEDTEADIVNMTPVGVARSNPAAQLAGVILGQAQGLAENYRLYELSNYTGRLEANLQSKAGLLQPAAAVSGVFEPHDPDYAAALQFSARIQGAAAASTNYNFPDWPSQLVGNLDFPIH